MRTLILLILLNVFIGSAHASAWKCTGAKVWKYVDLTQGLFYGNDEQSGAPLFLFSPYGGEQTGQTVAIAMTVKAGSVLCQSYVRGVAMDEVYTLSSRQYSYPIGAHIAPDFWRMDGKNASDVLEVLEKANAMSWNCGHILSADNSEIEVKPLRITKKTPFFAIDILGEHEFVFVDFDIRRYKQYTGWGVRPVIRF